MIGYIINYWIWFILAQELKCGHLSTDTEQLINNLNNKLINKVYCYAKGFSFSECAMQSSLYQV